MGATYYLRKDRGRRGRKSWVVVVRWQGERQLQIVHSEQDAKALVQMIHKQELAGVNVMETIRLARAEAAPSPDPVPFPTLREAVPAWIERQERAGSRQHRDRLPLSPGDVGVSASAGRRPHAWRHSRELCDARDARCRHPPRA